VRILKAFVTDIDGTLTDENYRISIPAIRAIRRLEDQGIPVILASGNALPIVKTLRTYLGCTGVIICENGSVIEYLDSLKTPGDSHKVKRALAKLKDVCGNKIEEYWSNRYRLVDIALKRTLKREQIETVLSGIDGVRLVDSGFAYHINSRGVNKAEGLKVACELMKINFREVAAIGDSETDIDLLKASGFKIARANAPLSLKQVADHITMNSNGAGVAEASDLILSKNLV
jgi:hypothetical protein